MSSRFSWCVLAAALLSCSGGNEKVAGVPDSGNGLPGGACLDNDGDQVPGSGNCSHLAVVDCDDFNPRVKPGMAEACNDLDDDCNGKKDDGLHIYSYFLDGDGDGVGSQKTGEGCALPPQGQVAVGGDCNDSHREIHPGAAESCNEVDDDCSGKADDGLRFQDFYPDLDQDDYGDSRGTALSSCQLLVPGRVPNKADCDDQNPAIKPSAPEVCNQVDDDCDLQVDDGLVFLDYYPDGDGDSYGAAGATPQSSCLPVPGKTPDHSDCNDLDRTVHPGAQESCNDLDDDCDGQKDNGLAFQSYWPDADSDNHGSSSAAAQASCRPLSGKVNNNSDCDDTRPSVHPGSAEACNDLDDNCDGRKDEGNPGGGASCGTGQPGVCSKGTLTCQGGSLTCPRDRGPSSELCNQLDDDCDNQTDEDFPLKGQSCTAGQGVCARSGGYLCKADFSGTYCDASPGSPTAAACDGLDNDCDGVADEPYFSATSDLDPTAYQDLEVAPYYYSAASCAGGTNGSGTDALAGGALAMGVGAGGILFQRLEVSGAPLGAPTVATYLTYLEIGLAQAGDGFLVAGIYPSGGIGREIDLYYLDQATGSKRTYLWSKFNTGYELDSLRVVRGNGGRVTLIWRDAGWGVLLASVQPVWSSSTSSWELRDSAGGLNPQSYILVDGASVNVLKGIGADSNLPDWSGSQSCQPLTSYRRVAVAYRPSASEVRFFTVDEDAYYKSAETGVYAVSSPRVLDEPEVSYFESGGDQWLVAYVTRDSSPAQADLNYWLTTAPSWHYAYLAYATPDGADSIRRPRASVSPSHLWLTALRYVPDPSGLQRQIMSRKIDFLGQRDPPGSQVEISVSSGACGSEPFCRPGNKDGLAVWAASGRLYYSGSGGTVAGTFGSVLTCN